MAKQVINRGTGPDTGTGESPYTGMGKVNDNFTELYDKDVAQDAQIALKLNANNPAITGTPTGLVKAHVGLASVDNTADSAKPVSTAQATAIALGDNQRLKVSDVYGNFIATGLTLPVPSNSRDGVLSTGIAYIDGVRVDKTAATNKQFSIDVDTYVDMDSAGAVTYVETGHGIAPAAPAAGKLRLFKVVTNATPIITSVTRMAGNFEYEPSPSTVITVGANGRYPTLNEALDYLSALTGNDVWTEIPGAGTVSVTQNSDEVIGTGTSFLTSIQPDDYISIAGDGNGVFVTGTLRHTLWHVKTNLSLRLGTGFIGATGSGKAYSIWRPVKYTIVMLAGEHRLSGDHILPNGLWVSISGANKASTKLILENNSAISIQRSNIVDIGNFTLYSEDGTGQLIGFMSGLGILDCGLGSYHIHDIHTDYEGEESTLQTVQLLSARGSSIRISNITGRCASAFAVTMADYIEYNNVHFESYNVGADCVQCTGYGAFSATKPWIYNNLGLDRKLAGVTGGGSMWELNGVAYGGVYANTKYVHLNDCYIIDRDQQSSSMPTCMQIATTMSNSKIYMNNVLIDGARGLNAGCGSTVEVFLKNVTNLKGDPISLTVTPTAQYFGRTRGKYSLPYAATVTPRPALGETHVIGTLTGNITIDAPMYPLEGQELTFVFQQDATGGRTISWNFLYKKSADGVGAANQRGSIKFVQEGLYWVQVGGGLTWVS